MWRPLIRQPQFLHRQVLSPPGAWRRCPNVPRCGHRRGVHDRGPGGGLWCRVTGCDCGKAAYGIQAAT